VAQEPPSLISAFLPLLVIIPAGVLYAATLCRATQRCAPERRTMSPRLVWLLFIPVLNFIWNFVVVARVASSLRAEFEGRGVPGPHGAGLWVGMAMSGLLCLGALPMFGSAFALTAVPRMSTARHQRRGVD
jgi:hypothetical protein